MGNGTAAVPSSDVAWMSTAEVCKALGVGLRAVQRFAQEGRLVKKEIPKGNGVSHTTALYNPESVERLKAQRDAGVREIAPAKPVATVAPGFEIVTRQLEVLAAIAQAIQKRPEEKSDTLFVSLKDASALLGLSEAWIVRQIHDGRLPAERDRDRWMVRRSDLEELPARKAKR